MAEGRAENLFQRVDREFKAMQREFTLPLKKSAFLCCADCCDSPGSLEQIEQCAASCHDKASAVDQAIDRQAQGLVRKFTRCAELCSRSAEEVAENKSMSAAQKKFDACAEKCVDECEKALPKLISKMRVDLQNAALS